MMKFQLEIVRNLKKLKIPTEKPYMMLSDDQKKTVWEGYGKTKAFNLFMDFVDSNSSKVQYRIMANRYRGYTSCKVCGASRLRLLPDKYL